MNEPVGRRLRMLRMLSGESQTRLAEMLGLTIQQLEDFENGTNAISESQLYQLSAELNVPPSFFFEYARDGEVRPEEPDAGKIVHLNLAIS
jgi:transcriptional regulator with XRE-family HTH domain